MGLVSAVLSGASRAGKLAFPQICVGRLISTKLHLQCHFSEKL